MNVVEEFEKNIYDNEKYLVYEDRRRKFVSTYTPDRISSLELSEYCFSGIDDTFCHKLEYNLSHLASMGNAYPEVFGVYIDLSRKIRINKRLKNSFTDNYGIAFDYQKQMIVDLLDAGRESDYKAIEESGIFQQFKFKLLSIYYPDKYFPVCTKPAADGYCEVIGLKMNDKATMLDKNIALVKWKEEHLPDDWTLHKTMCFCDWIWKDTNRKIDANFNMKFDKEKIANEINAEISGLNLTGEYTEAVVKQRVNQGIFRDRLLMKYDKCILCGVNESGLLVASHIKPWSASLPAERLDINNGFLMCPNHDKLFDKGYITFDNDGNIIISSLLSDVNRLFLNINNDMHIEITEANKKYLKYHRMNIFNK